MAILHISDCDQINLGTIEIILSGRIIPLHKRPKKEQSNLAKELAQKLEEHVSKYYFNSFGEELPGNFVVEVIGIESGCIKISLETVWKDIKRPLSNSKEILFIVSALVTLTMAIEDFAKVEQQPYSTSQSAIKCNFQRGKSNIIQEAIATKDGDTLYGILQPFYAAKKMEVGNIYTYQQLLFSIFECNPNAFLEENIHKLKSDTILLIPSDETIKKVDPVEAEKILDE